MKDNLNIKKIVLVLTFVMVISLLIAGSIFTSALRSGSFRNYDVGSSLKGLNWISFGRVGVGSNHFDINEKEIIDISNLASIQISTISAPINLYVGEDTNELVVHYYGNIETSAQRPPELEVKTTGGKLKINEKRQNSIGFNREKITMDIYLPIGYEKLLSLNSVSGSIEVDMAILQQLDIETVSGRIYVNRAQVAEGRFQSISGKINLKNYSGKLYGKSVSGAVDAELEELSNPIEISTTSGKISLKLPKDAGFELNAKSTSGKIESEFPILIQRGIERNHIQGVIGDGNNQVELQSVSGSINIYN